MFADAVPECPTPPWPHGERRRARAGQQPVRIRDLMTFAGSDDPSARYIRREQLREMLRSAPVAIGASAATTMLFAIHLAGQPEARGVWWWCAAMLGLLALRLANCLILRRDLAQENESPRAFGEITAILAAQALLWLVPAACWFATVDEASRIFITIFLIATMSSATTTLATVPPAAILFVVITSLAVIHITVVIGSPIMAALALLLALVVTSSALSSARLFVGHVRARGELEEQGELIKLLREFQSSGSDWLWELDGQCCIKFMSRAMADSIGRPVERLIGRQLRSLVDPRGEYQLQSDGIRALFMHLDKGNAFHEIAFPTIDGSRWYCLSGRPVMDGAGAVAGWRGVGSDITALRSGPGTEGPRVARRDPLTGLANRLMVRELIEEARLRQLNGQGTCVLLLLDLDRFKMVNDTLGHAVGDRLLAEVARRLEGACGAEGSVGRLGGDEFAVIWRGGSDTLTLLNLAARITERIDRAFTIGPSSINIGVSIGIARAPLDGETEDELMRSADLALYRSKEQGRHCSTFYEPWMLAKAEAERLLESDVREAVRRGDLHLNYQPIVDAHSFAVVGHEALLRWSHPRRGAIGPDVFVPIIEDVGLIHQIGDWVIREACAEAARWPGDRRVAVNISVAQLTGAGLKETVEEGLAASGLAPGRLELEVTENVFLGDDVATLAALASLQSLGVRLVLDDFGKGYSSFGYLSRACFSKIKIDQLFVRGAASGRRESMAIVKSILALARGLGVETTAEGIETAAQAELLAHLGCTQLQGFLFGKPVPAVQVERDLLASDDARPVLPLKRRA
ncbi:MAG: EAL domain-containing protein [Sphingomicrobium sp.]